MVACQNGHLDIVRLLVELGAGVNYANRNGYTPCYIACENGHLEIIQLLVELGADPLIKNDVSFLSFLSLS